MKKVLLFAILASLLFACGNNKQFKINGQLIPAKEGKVVLYSFKDGSPVPADTTVMKEGKFEFKGDVSLPDIRLIGLAGQPSFIGQLFVEKGKIDMTIYPDSFQANKVVGSESQDIFQKYIDEVVLFSKKENELRQRFQQAQMSGNQQEMEAVKFEYETISGNTRLYAKNFIAEYNTSPVAAYVYLMNFYQEATIEDLDSILKVFDKTIKGSQFVEAIREQAESIRATTIGAIAPDFSLNGPDGKAVSLSSLKGKVVLIDFWASWCQPCMVEMPNVIELYNTYKDKGFEIYGVSLDREKDAWLNALQTNPMNWVHGWDLEGSQRGDVATKYGVSGIPYTVLLDREGKIVANNLSGEALKEKLAEMLP